MTTGTMTPVPATELVKKNAAGFANESAANRKARNSLLAEEIELQRRIDAVAEQRRALPPGPVIDIEQRVALAVLGRSTVERQVAFAGERGWRHLKFHQTVGDDYALDFGGLDPENGWEYPVLAVFRRQGTGEDAKVRLFWKGEMTGEMADEGKDPRGGPDIGVVWPILDLTPEGRGTDWYPKLEY